MLRTFIQALMAAEADALCGAPHGERSPERVNRRNGYRERQFDTRTGTIELLVPNLRSGSYFPDWLVEPRRRAERPLVQVVAECHVKGVSTRRVDGLIRTLGIEGSPSPMSPPSPSRWTRRSRRSGTVPSTHALTPTCGSMLSRFGAGRRGGSSRWPR
jgi:transposase-like protein